MRNKSPTDWKQLVLYFTATEFLPIGLLHENILLNILILVIGMGYAVVKICYLFFFFSYFILNVVWENCSVVDCNMAIIDCLKFDRNFAMAKKKNKRRSNVVTIQKQYKMLFWKNGHRNCNKLAISFYYCCFYCSLDKCI